MLIKNYGLYWAVDEVSWGRPHHLGQLLGVPAKNKRFRATDFREQAGIYVLHDGIKVVYVGETGIGDKRLLSRLNDHRKDHLAGRWNTFSWFGVYPVNATSRTLRRNVHIKPQISDVLNHIEAILLAVIEPPLNLQRGKFGQAARYEQKILKEGKLDQAEALQEILDRIAEIEEGLNARA